MSVFSKLGLASLAALVLCAALASSASALTAFENNGATPDPLTVGAAVTATGGPTTLSGSFFGVALTVSCSTVSYGGTVSTNGGATVTAAITSAAYSGCGTTLSGACSATAIGLPWNASNSGGLVATSTTSVGVAAGTSGAVDVSSCMPFGSTCTLTGGTASFGGLSNVTVGTWTNSTTAPQLAIAGAGDVKPKSCTAANLETKVKLTLKKGTTPVGLRTP